MTHSNVNHISQRRCLHPKRMFWAARLCASLLFLQAVPGYADSSELAGSIEANVNGKIVQFPTVNSSVAVDLRGDLALVRITQRFNNPLQVPIHARYVFPLNKNAAVSGLVMNVGNERIRAQIQEKEQAKRTFEQAKSKGQAASLLTQQRPNMFTQRIANLMPGLPIEVVIEYSQALTRVDGAYELVVPTVVGPRFVPKGMAEPVGLGENPAASPVVGVSVPETVDAGRIAIDVSLNSAVGFSEISSNTHPIEVETQDASRATATLAQRSVVPNRDFVLRYKLGNGVDVAAGALSYADKRGTFFSLLLEPPEAWLEDEVTPREMVFLLDCSGSMSGQPMEASKAFMREALATLRPTDSFRIIRFSDYPTEFSREPLLATPDNIASGIRYTNSLKGSGGTVMKSGVEQALTVAKLPGALRNVVFLTDGYIGNEYEILRLVNRELGAARLFALGVGSGVNRFLLDELARVGKGFARYLDSTADVSVQARALAERLQTPLLTDVRIDWGTVTPQAVTPTKIPDLYAGDSVRVQGRYPLGGVTPGSYDVVVQGNSGGSAVTLPLTLTLNGSGSEGESIALIWARSAIKDAMHQFSSPQELRINEVSDEKIKNDVTQLGLDFSLLTQWTAFVAVSEQVYNSDPTTTTESRVPQAKVAGVSAKAYSQVPHGGYAAPEPASWLGMLLLLGLFGGLLLRQYRLETAGVAHC